MVPTLSRDQVSLVPFGELALQVATRIGIGEVARHRLWLWAEPHFDREVSKRFSGRAPILYGQSTHRSIRFGSIKVPGDCVSCGR
jgi:hypothetical protein